MIFFDQPDAADIRGRQYGQAFGFVVERHVPRYHRELQYRAGLPHAFDAADELGHDIGLFRVAEIEAVGDRQRFGAGRRQVAPRLGDGLFATLHRVGEAIARRAVGGDGERLVGAVDADYRRVAAGTAAAQRVGHDHMVVLLPDPALGGQVGASQQLLQRRHRVIGGRDIIGGNGFGLRLGRERALLLVVFRRRLGQRVDGQVGHNFPLVAQHHVPGVGQRADDGEIQFPFLEDGPGLVLGAGLQHHQHPFLGFRQHHLVGAHVLFALRHPVEIQIDAHAALGRHFER